MPIMQLKDGTKIRFRDGMDPNDVYRQYTRSRAPKWNSPEMQEKIAAQQASDREEYDPTKGMSKAELLTAGVSRGVRKVGRGLGNMARLISDEDVNAADDLDAPLLATTPGKIGDVVGGTLATGLATAPLGAAFGAVRGAGTLASTLRAGAGNVAAQGALGGAINARAGERKEGALLGAALGGGTYGVLKGATKLGTGLAGLSDDAKRLQDVAGEMIPLDSGLSAKRPFSRTLRTVYGLAREAPVSGSQLANQKADVFDKIVSQYADDAVPKSLGISPKFSADDLATNHASAKAVDDAIEAVIAPVKPMKVALGGVSYQRNVASKVQALKSQNFAAGKEVQEVLDKYIPPESMQVSLEQVLKAMSRIKSVRSAYGGTNNASGAGRAIDDVLNGLYELGRRRAMSSTNPNALDSWERGTKIFRDEYWQWRNFRRGINDDGSITTESLRKGLKGSETSFAHRAVPNQELVTLTDRVLNKEGANASSGFRTGVALGPAGGTVSALLTGAGLAAGGPVGAAGGAAILPSLATRSVQKALVGEFGSQKALAEALRRNPDAVRALAAKLTAAEVAAREGN